MSSVRQQDRLPQYRQAAHAEQEMKGKEAPPNIVVILSDDQGAWAMGCAGNDEIITPNLDHLAETGVRFENFFCTSPVCSPARASLLTGKIPSQHGVHDWIKAGNVGKDALEYLAGQTAYTEILAQHGYVCGLSGKWHLGDSIRPQKGFTHWYVHQTGGGPYYDAPMIRDGKCYREPGYITEKITDDALNFIDQQAGSGRPFYLSVHYTAPHSPWINQHPEKYVQMYEDCPLESVPVDPKHPWLIPNAPGANNHRESLKGYYASITAMDDQIGRIIRKLEQLNFRENTLIVFLSDNGFNFGHHGIWGKGNGTFPQNMYDTSVKVPAIFSHPGKIPAARVSEALVSGYDFFPTILQYAGLGGHADDDLPGRSFYDELVGKPFQQEKDPIVVFDEYGPVRMIRTKEWKYVHRYPYGPHELYHLAVDPDEKANLIDDPSCADQVKTMRQSLEQWFVKYADPAVDGVREPVTGNGQIHLAGLKGNGQRAYE